MKIFTFIICFLLSVAGYAQPQFITIGKTNLAYKSTNLDKRKPGEPVIVFESGFGSGGGNFDGLVQSLPGIPTFVYDRNGLGESAIDASVKTDSDVVKQLHNLLSAAKIDPPYLLVGHSLGGPFIRLYASMYPDEVCGLVFIDPTDFMLTPAEDEQAKKASGSKTGYMDLIRGMFKQMADDSTLSEGVRNEARRELATISPEFFKEYKSLPPLKDIPVTVIISYAKPVESYEEKMNKDLNLGINIIPWWKEYDRLRNNHYTDMIARNHNSRLILLPGYSHGIHHQDPQLVATAIREVHSYCLKK